jgi:hypothetical protein
MDKNSFSDKIFGAIKEHKVIGQLLDTYAKQKDWKTYSSFAERIKEVLIICQGMHIDGKTDIYNEKASVFGPEVFVLNEGAGIHMTCHNFKKLAEDAEYITVKRSSLL